MTRILSTCVMCHSYRTWYSCARDSNHSNRLNVQVTTILAGNTLEASGVNPKLMKCVTKCVRNTAASIDSLKASLDIQLQAFSHLVRYLNGIQPTTTVRSLTC
jgi:hypothetical protein